MHYYQFNIKDYLGHTAHLEPLEDLAYRRMLDWQYLNESKLPKNIDEIARIIRMRTHSESIALVLREFFVLDADGYTNTTAMANIEAYREKSEKAKNSAKARWSKTKGLADANALETQSECNANHKPLTNNHKPIEKRVAKAPSRKKGTRVDSWLIDEDSKAFAIQLVGRDRANGEYDKFMDYFRALSGAKATKLDWPATWRNWIRRAAEFNGKPSASNDTQKQDFIKLHTSDNWADGL